MSHQQTLLSYTKLLAAHVNNARHEKALALFTRMHSNPSLTLDSFVLPLALKSSSALRLTFLGTSVHAHAIKASHLISPFVSCALVDMYGKCLSINLARQLFDEIPERNVVVWNSMISIYSSTKDVFSALQLFKSMDVDPNASTFNSIIAALSSLDDGGGNTFAFFRRMEEFGVKPNLITVLALLPACIGFAGLNFVKEIHGYAVRNGISPHLQFSSCIVEVYARCGCLRNARYVFELMPERDVVTYSSMISAYALHGEAKSALLIFQEMELAGVRPDGITYLGVLKGCSHAGLPDEALRYFVQMGNVYGLKATSDHYSCLVDVLSRAGRVHEAYEIIKESPVKASAKAWGALLGACRTYQELELAKIAGEVLCEIEPNNAANYVLLASVYAGVGMFDEAERVRRQMREKCVDTLPGGSWVINHN